VIASAEVTFTRVYGTDDLPEDVRALAADRDAVVRFDRTMRGSVRSTSTPIDVDVPVGSAPIDTEPEKRRRPRG